MSLGLPLFAWGTADDISASPWASTNTPVVTGGQTDPFGGTGATLVNDDDGALAEYRKRTIAFIGTSAVIPLCAKQGTATTSHSTVSNAAEGVGRSRLTWTWSGGVPTVTASTGSVTSAVSLGGGWYLVLWSITSGLTSTDKLLLYGATDSGAATGSTYWYLRNIALLDYLDTPVSYQKPRAGSKWVQSFSGVEDSWIGGPDYCLDATARWIPAAPRSTPIVVSGWDGRADATGVGCGVAAMLKAGREKQTLTYVPDRSACTTYIDSYLVEPMEDAPKLESNGSPDRTFPLTLRNASTPYEGVP